MRLFLFSSVLLLLSCITNYDTSQEQEPDYDNVEQKQEPDLYFNFSMTDEQEKQIYDSYDERVVISEPLPQMFYGGRSYNVNRFNTRGKSTLRFRKKSFSVKLEDPIRLPITREGRVREFEKFKLISMVSDYTYIEHSLARGFCFELDLWPMHSFFTEVRLNDNTNGIYFFIEDPERHFLSEKNSSFILRRDYFNAISDFKPNKSNIRPDTYYFEKFNSIYDFIIEYDGKELYDSLMTVLDLDQYFSKIALDLLLQNGDYVDEIFFYTKNVDGREIFGVCPWDYDDLFKALPHEIGSDWSVGRLFGNRYYACMEDVYEDVGVKLIFSIEDDLDYTIAKDEYLYTRYLDVLEDVMVNTITDQVIENVVHNTRNEIQPFYEREDIVAQSQYDYEPTNKSLFTDNLAEKSEFLIQRRTGIIQQLQEKRN